MHDRVRGVYEHAGNMPGKRMRDSANDPERAQLRACVGNGLPLRSHGAATPRQKAETGLLAAEVNPSMVTFAATRGRMTSSRAGNYMMLVING